VIVKPVLIEIDPLAYDPAVALGLDALGSEFPGPHEVIVRTIGPSAGAGVDITLATRVAAYNDTYRAAICRVLASYAIHGGS
jgi:hypothetical protein